MLISGFSFVAIINVSSAYQYQYITHHITLRLSFNLFYPNILIKKKVTGGLEII